MHERRRIIDDLLGARGGDPGIGPPGGEIG
jgi:hypothetical protein